MTNINDYQYYNMILLLNSIFKIYYKVIYLYLAIKEISFDYKKISYIIFMSSLYEVLMLKFLQSDSIWIYFIIFLQNHRGDLRHFAHSADKPRGACKGLFGGVN